MSSIDVKIRDCLLLSTHITSSMEWFKVMGVPRFIIHFNRMFHSKPFSYWGIPIPGNLHKPTFGGGSSYLLPLVFRAGGLLWFIIQQRVPSGCKAQGLRGPSTFLPSLDAMKSWKFSAAQPWCAGRRCGNCHWGMMAWCVSWLFLSTWWTSWSW